MKKLKQALVEVFQEREEGKDTQRFRVWPFIVWLLTIAMATSAVSFLVPQTWASIVSCVFPMVLIAITIRPVVRFSAKQWINEIH